MLHYYAAINLFDHTLQNIPSLKFILKHPSYYFDPFNCILRLVVLVLGITLGIALYRTTKGVKKLKVLAIVQSTLSVIIPILATYVMFLLRVTQGDCQLGKNDFELMTSTLQGCEFMPTSAVVYILLPYLVLITTSILSTINLVKIKKSEKSTARTKQKSKAPAGKIK